MVGPEATTGQMQEVYEYAAASTTGVKLVRPVWLQRCLEARCEVAVDFSCTIAPAQLAPTRVRAPQGWGF